MPKDRPDYLVERATRLLRPLQDDMLLSIPRAARILGYSPATLRKYVATAHIHTVPFLEGQRRIFVAEIKRFNKEGSCQLEADPALLPPNSDVEPLPIIRNKDGSVDLTLLTPEQLKQLGSDHEP